MTRVNEALRQAAGEPFEPDPADPAADAVDAGFISDGGSTYTLPPDEPGPTTVVRSARSSTPVRIPPALTERRGSDEDIRITDFLQALYRRWYWIAAAVLVCVAGASAYNQIATPIYQARVRVLIEPTLPNIVAISPVESEDPSRYEYYQTQIEVLRSRTLARRALERMGTLPADADEQRGAIGGLVGSLTVSAVNESRVVNVAISSPDPEYAAKAANALAESYVAENLESRSRASREASEWLTARLAELRQEVDASAGKLQQFREQNDESISLDDRQNMVVQKLAQLTTAVTTARTQRIEKQTLYAQLQSLEESGLPLDTFPPIVANPFIQGLKAELAGLQRERAQLAEQLGDEHPDMIRVDTAIGTARARLDAEVAKVADGVRTDLRAVQANERALAAALEEQKDEVLALNRQSIGYGSLQRDAQSTQQIFEAVLQRVKEADLTGELKANNIRILDRAEVPGGPISPNTTLNLLVALFGGLVSGVGLVAAVQFLSPRLATPAEIGEGLGLPVLGIAPRIAALKGGRGGLRGEAVSAGFREAFRGIRTSLLLSPGAAHVRTLAVTSTVSGEGKTVVATNLAISMAMAGRRVLLVDGDLRRSRLHVVFDVPRTPGLSDVITGAVAARDAVRDSGFENLSVLPAGAIAGSAADILESSRLHDMIEALSADYDFVVLDSPPTMAVADASIIAHAASTVLFVVGAGTGRDAAQVALQRLAASQAQVIGVVLNKAEMSRMGQGYYGEYVRERDDYYEQPEPQHVAGR